MLCGWWSQWWCGVVDWNETHTFCLWMQFKKLVMIVSEETGEHIPGVSLCSLMSVAKEPISHSSLYCTVIRPRELTNSSQTAILLFWSTSFQSALNSPPPFHFWMIWTDIHLPPYPGGVLCGAKSHTPSAEFGPDPSSVAGAL